MKNAGDTPPPPIALILKGEGYNEEGQDFRDFSQNEKISNIILKSLKID